LAITALSAEKYLEKLINETYKTKIKADKQGKREVRTLDEILDEIKENSKSLDQALESLTPKERKEYEEAIELWVTYGGD
jgi:hypothetical protein